jgi:hypothetical protein
MSDRGFPVTLVGSAVTFLATIFGKSVLVIIISEYLKMIADWPFGTVCAFLIWCGLIFLMVLFLGEAEGLADYRLDCEVYELTR